MGAGGRGVGGAVIVFGRFAVLTALLNAFWNAFWKVVLRSWQVENVVFEDLWSGCVVVSVARDEVDRVWIVEKVLVWRGVC